MSLSDKICFNVRGQNTLIYTNSNIFNFSKLLNAYLIRWNINENEPLYLDIDPYSFNSLLNYFNHIKEMEIEDSELNKKIYETFHNNFSKNANILATLNFLEINSELAKEITKKKWTCNHEVVKKLNDYIDMKWHYSDCISYIFAMIEENHNDITINFEKSFEDTPKKTQLSILNINIFVIHTDKPNNHHKIILGTFHSGSYQYQFNSIQYKSFENLHNEIKDLIQKTKHETKINTYLKECIQYIHFYNKPEKRFL